MLKMALDVFLTVEKILAENRGFYIQWYEVHERVAPAALGGVTSGARIAKELASLTFSISHSRFPS